MYRDWVFYLKFRFLHVSRIGPKLIQEMPNRPCANDATSLPIRRGFGKVYIMYVINYGRISFFLYFY